MAVIQRFPNAPQNYDAQNEAQFRNLVKQAIADASSPLALTASVGQSFNGVAGDLLTHANGSFVATDTITGDVTFSGNPAFTGTPAFADINVDGGFIDGTPIGSSVPSNGAFTTLNATGGGSLLGNWTSLGVVATVDINGGTLDGVPVGSSVPASGAFTTLNATGGGSLAGTWSNLGTVATVDINGGTIDGTPIGGAAPAAGAFTSLNATGGGSLAGTWSDLGTVTTVDVDGGTLDGVVVGGATPAAGTFTTLAADALYLQHRTVTATTDTALVTDGVIFLNAASNDVTLTLPTAAAGDGQVLIVKRIDASAQVVTIDGDAAETIDGSATKALVSLETVRLISDGTEWWVI